MISYNAYYQTFRDNHWQYEATSAHNRGTPWTAFYLRDSSSFNLFERDTVLAGVNSPGYTFAALLSASGSFPASVQGNTMRGCVFKLRGDLYTQDGFATGS